MGFRRSKLTNNGTTREQQDEHPIYAYSDQDAIDDGVLVNIRSYRLNLNGAPVNRITRHLFDDLMKCAQHDDAILKEILREKLSHAAVPQDSPADGYFYVMPPTIWAVRNEVKGYTLMFPEDY